MLTSSPSNKIWTELRSVVDWSIEADLFRLIMDWPIATDQRPILSDRVETLGELVDND